MACIKLYCLLFFAACSIYGDVSGDIQRGTVIPHPLKPWNRGNMPYAFSKTMDDNQKRLVEQSMRNIEQAVNIGGSACFSFKENSKERNPNNLYISIDANNGVCNTEAVGETENGRQELQLADNCFNMSNIVSLLVVTMGLYPAHQRHDRDQYIQVHMDNVQGAARSQFDVIPSGDTDLLGLPYDFHSITHYGPYQYAIDTSLPTITTNVSGVTFGERNILSFYDVLKIQTLYKCTKGYTMYGQGINRFKQMPSDCYYPQWRISSEDLPEYMNTTCDTEGNYTLTVLNGATWESKFPLPSGNFCVSVNVCIASSSSPEINSYIQLTTKEGLDISKLNYTRPSGYWETFKRTFTSEKEWTMLVKAYVMWGGDVLALNSTVITRGVCGL